jgi:phosphohistidine phosphatase
VKLYVMRHGPAEDSAPSGKDFDRALTTSGRARVRSVVEELARREELPRFIISSPLIRALQTAEIVAAVARPEEQVSVRREMAPGGDAHGLVRELLDAGRRRVMVVGHEPDVSSLVAQLLPTFSSSLDKAMVVGVSVEDHACRRRFVLHPKELAWR